MSVDFKNSVGLIDPLFLYNTNEWQIASLSHIISQCKKKAHY